MALENYHRLRNFSTTSEPKGEENGVRNSLIFVVQQHAASHLHYDFRLEVGGVLKSWAIPKGPSLNPSHRRLAIMVEDHPFAYKDFEGVIPEGNYGAGKVIVWDTGTYTLAHEQPGSETSTKAILNGLQEGHLGFVLNGSKLRGEFALVKLPTKQDTTWLLIKKRDSFASKDNVLEQDRSVVSGLRVSEI